MIAYIVRRLFSMIPTFLLAALLVFLFMHLIPGDPASVMLGDMATIDQVAKLREEMGLNKPLYVQFGIWFAGMLKGDLGRSIFYEKPVLEVIAARAETSIFIATISMTIIVLVGITVGILSAIRYNTTLDQVTSGLSMFGASIPTFWLGLNLMLLFAVVLRWLPSSGFPSVLASGDVSNFRYLILPSITLAAPNSALIIRLTRASMLDIMREDYVMTARSKGLSESSVNIKHVFRNALISVVAALGFTFVGLASGTVVTETVFALPGIGRLVVESVSRRDYPVIQGVVLVIVAVYMIFNLLVDLSYAYLDPRIRYS